MKTLVIEIQGITPLLVHRFSEEASSDKATRKIKVDQADPRTEALKVAYIDNNGNHCFSGFSITSAMGNAGAGHKMKGSRKTLRFIVPAAVRIMDELIVIQNGAGPYTTCEVDSRPVTIPATKGRIMRHRPRYNQWGASFNLLLNDDMLAVSDAHTLLNEAGISYGIGDFRPEKRGPFGTFRVTKFEELR